MLAFDASKFGSVSTSISVNASKIDWLDMSEFISSAKL
jgi:hypothetical protein